MSKIVAFRNRVIETIKTAIPEIVDIDWYDGIFDEQDVDDWTIVTPAARVAVMNVPTDHMVTGELNADLRCVVVIINQDKLAGRDGDDRTWDLVERLAVLANHNQFGDPDAAPATRVQFKRIGDPAMRREGISVGVVEWESGLAIGNNSARDRSLVWHMGVPVTQTPQTRVLTHAVIHRADEEAEDGLDITPEVP